MPTSLRCCWLSVGCVGADDLAQPSGAPERYGCGTPFAGAVRPTAPEARNSFPDSPEVPFLPQRCNCAAGGILFSVVPEKSMQKRGAGGREIALTREKACRYTLRIIVTSVVKERPSGGAPNFVYGNIAPR